MDETENPENLAPATPAEAKTTETQGEPERGPIPYERFQEVVTDRNSLQDKLATLEARLNQIDQERETQQRQEAEEQGRYKELYENALQEMERREQEAETARREAMRKAIGEKYNLPPRIVERLRGDTEAELEADAQALAGELPTPVAPNIDSSRTPASRVDVVTPEQFKRMSFSEQQELYSRDPDLFKQLLRGK